MSLLDLPRSALGSLTLDDFEEGLEQLRGSLADDAAGTLRAARWARDEVMIRFVERGAGEEAERLQEDFDQLSREARAMPPAPVPQRPVTWHIGVGTAVIAPRLARPARRRGHARAPRAGRPVRRRGSRRASRARSGSDPPGPSDEPGPPSGRPAQEAYRRPAVAIVAARTLEWAIAALDRTHPLAPAVLAELEFLLEVARERGRWQP